MAASYLAAPRFTSEDEALERASMTIEEKLAALHDLYGEMPIPEDEMDGLVGSSSTDPSPLPVRVEETEELIENALKDLEHSLVQACGSSDGKDGGEGQSSLSLTTPLPFQEARRRCPDIVDSRRHRLLFLRAENFDATLAAKRLLKYWYHRSEIFGESYAFGPLTLESGAFDGVRTELSIGYPRLLPIRDKSGRALIVINHSSVKRNTYSRSRMIQACWYVMHRAIEDDIVQQRGIVMIGLGYGQLDQIDRKLDAATWRNMVDIMPCRVVASHIFVGVRSADLILPNVKFMIGRTARARLREYYSYSGNDPQILKKLERYGIEPEMVPSEIGGSWVYDNKWFESEKENE